MRGKGGLKGWKEATDVNSGSEQLLETVKHRRVVELLDLVTIGSRM